MSQMANGKRGDKVAPGYSDRQEGDGPQLTSELVMDTKCRQELVEVISRPCRAVGEV